LDNAIIGIMGKKGSGKSFFVKKAVPKIKRIIVLDPLYEYSGTICESWTDVIEYLKEFKENDFRAIYRPPDDEDVEGFLSIINTVNDYTLVAEEVDFFCSPNDIHPELLKLTKYGRHFKRSLLWLSRNPYEVNRFLTRQSDALITFRQTEPRDLDYFKRYNFNKNLEGLEEYEMAFSGSRQIITKIWGADEIK